uniref:Uncharacterized protein n=1 Tax=Globisporangium ultimum (strain ATCC 200006 / CBS 805.95 / DAOM BR144) TaxID=431595 RepID=K3WHN4_GLOUD
MERDRILQDRDRVRQEQENLRAKQINQLQQQQAEKQREQAIRQVHQRERIQSLPELVDELDSAGRYAAKARPYDTSTHAQSAPGQIEAKEREDPKRSASARTSASTFSASGSRVIRRPLTSRGFSVARTIDTSMNDTRYEHQPDQRQISFTGPYTAGNEISDQEIRNHFGSIPRTFEEDGYLTSFGPADVLINPDNPLETISSLDDGRGGYRSVDGPSYTVFSPTNSLTSTNYGSFIAPGYDLLSPMNSIHDDDFPSDQLPQVYRSIRYSGPPTAAARITEFADQEARRDKVHFNAFAPPTVAPSPKPFHFTVWAFLLSQRDEMRERAETFDPDSSRLTVDTKLDIRRGALVHVTLEAPSGFRILNGATQGFSWGGKVCNA